ncbi:CLUMA_CG018342, isoform A [Clunio marinus]|uniref:CLUMA_CG018342, isoform A n=1 Tax=Clunio marinus TaxID=568069 RepID=A0A1J1IYQ5_9DIPT|nr:CLUMA_CG018342, isoform A [Clunio marinus]
MRTHSWFSSFVGQSVRMGLTRLTAKWKEIHVPFRKVTLKFDLTAHSVELLATYVCIYAIECISSECFHDGNQSLRLVIYIQPLQYIYDLRIIITRINTKYEIFAMLVCAMG